MEDSLTLMDSRRIQRSAKRIGYEVVEQNISDHPILLFGVNHRGYAVAQLLEEVLTDIFEGEIRAIQLPLKKDIPQEDFNNLSAQTVTDSLPIVVDDVIFTGRTMFQALKKITDEWKPEEVHTAVLIDRGHRKFPLQAEFYGMELPTKHNEHVSIVTENGEIKEVLLHKYQDN